MKYLWFFLYLTSCNYNVEHQHVYNVDPAFQVYVQQWHNDAITTLGHDFGIDDLIIEFGNIIQLGEKGVCYWGSNVTPLIQIDTTWWNEGQDIVQLQSLIYHEMGHCILNRVHTSEMISINGLFYQVYKSIMNPYAYIDDYYNANYRQHILEEYFYVQ